MNADPIIPLGTAPASHAPRGVDASHQPVEKFCIDCGGIFYTPACRAHGRNAARRCAACQETYKVECERERALATSRKRHAYTRKGDWMIERDPDGLWCYHTTLDRGEIDALARADSLCPGTIFHHSRHPERKLVILRTPLGLVVHERVEVTDMTNVT